MPLYRRILSQAWKMTWQNKYLWFFGLFALLFCTGGEYNILVRIFSGNINQPMMPAFQRFSETGIFSPKIFSNIGTIMNNDPAAFLKVILVFIIVAVLSVFLIWLSVVSQAALVSLVSSLAGKKISAAKQGAVAKNISDNFRNNILRGHNKFWPVFGLNVINKLVVYAAFVLVSLPIVLTMGKSQPSVVIILYVLAFIVFVPAALSLSFIFKYAIAYTVIKGSKFKDALNSALELFKENWLISLEMSFILFILNFAVSLVVILLVLSLVIPFVFLAITAANIIGSAAYVLAIILELIIILSIIILSGSVISTFQIASWTGLFVELINKGGVSKIIRIAEDIKEKIQARAGN